MTLNVAHRNVRGLATRNRPCHRSARIRVTPRARLGSSEGQSERSVDSPFKDSSSDSLAATTAVTTPAATAAAESGCPFLRVAAPHPRPSRFEELATQFQSFARLIQLLSKPVQDPLERQAKSLSGKRMNKDFLLFIPALIVGDAKLAKDVLANEEAFPPGTARMKQFIGEEAVLLQSGPAHAKIRGLMAPFFAADEIEKYTPRVQELAVKYLDMMVEQSAGIQDVAKGPHALELFELFTLEVICRLVTGLNITDAELRELRADFKTMTSGMISPVTIDWPFLPYGKSLDARRRIMSRIQRQVESSRARLSSDPASTPRGVLDELVAYVDEQGQRLTDAQLRDNMLLFILAGYDTTAASLTSMFYFLHTHPKFARQLAEEQESVTARYGAKLTSQVLRSMRAADRVVRETLRLHPVVSGITRRAAYDMQAGEVAVREGDLVQLAFRYFGANDPQWRDCKGELAPEVFNPDRWLEGASASGVQMPFGHGKHICLGMSLALMEAKTVLAVLVRQYVLEQVAAPPSWDYLPLVMPSNGLPVLMRRKEA